VTIITVADLEQDCKIETGVKSGVVMRTVKKPATVRVLDPATTMNPNWAKVQYPHDTLNPDVIGYCNKDSLKQPFYTKTLTETPPPTEPPPPTGETTTNVHITLVDGVITSLKIDGVEKI